MTVSQASMHRPHWMQSTWRPLRISTACGQAKTQAEQSTQSPAGWPALFRAAFFFSEPRGSPRS